MAELRAVVMQPDLERLGRDDPERVRRRFLDAFTPAHTRVIQHAGVDVGLVATRHDADGVWIEHFYLDPARQGQGIGSWASPRSCARTREADRSGSTSRRGVLPAVCTNVTGSPSRTRTRSTSTS